MQKYKIKLKLGDFVSSKLSDDHYLRIFERFMHDGCPIFEGVDFNEFNRQPFFGWATHSGKQNDFKQGFYHAAQSAFSGKEYTFDQIMELAEPEESTDWHERGERPIAHEIIEWRGKRGGYWVPARVVDCNEKQICLLHLSDQKYKPGKMEVFDFENIDIRPIKTDREKAIEKALEHLPFVGINEQSANEFLGSLYDAGLLKLPEEK